MLSHMQKNHVLPCNCDGGEEKNVWEPLKNYQQDSRKMALCLSLRKNTSDYIIIDSKEADTQIYQWRLFDFCISTEN